MNQQTFKQWLDAYGRAWETGDPQAAAALFAPDAVYHETPFDEPMRGQAAIRNYWLEVPEGQAQVRFEYDILSTAPIGGIAHWRASFLRKASGMTVHLDGILAVEMDAEGRCTLFREWWHRHEHPPTT